MKRSQIKVKEITIKIRNLSNVLNGRKYDTYPKFGATIAANLHRNYQNVLINSETHLGYFNGFGTLILFDKKKKVNRSGFKTRIHLCNCKDRVERNGFIRKII